VSEGSDIRVTVKFLASYREEVGEDEIDLMLEPDATVAFLLEYLRDRFPSWGAMVSEPLVARNLEYVRPDEYLEDGDEIAIFPPVSGG
jgi:molybdopterin synthase sulfur carrier subunit